MPISASKLVSRIVNPKMDMNLDEEWSIDAPMQSSPHFETYAISLGTS